MSLLITLDVCPAWPLQMFGWASARRLGNGPQTFQLGQLPSLILSGTAAILMFLSARIFSLAKVV